MCDLVDEMSSLGEFYCFVQITRVRNQRTLQYVSMYVVMFELTSNSNIWQVLECSVYMGLKWIIATQELNKTEQVNLIRSTFSYISTQS